MDLAEWTRGLLDGSIPEQILGMSIKGLVEVTLASANTIGITLVLTAVISFAPLEGAISIGGFSVKIGNYGLIGSFVIAFGLSAYRSYDRIHCDWP